MQRTYKGRICLVVAAWLVLFTSPVSRLVQAQGSDRRATWLNDWAVAPGFSLSIDTADYDLPTSIAFVPNPGSGPNDPLYFVTELHGRIRVVTNDRSVHTFAERFFHLEPVRPPKQDEHLPELGMAGICLDPVHGYVFVSFTYQTPRGAILNNVVRFQSVPGTFSLAPTASVAFTEIFADQVGDLSHMIGPLAVHGEALFVQVGDSHVPRLTRSLNSTAGKILRMSLDGKPLPDNPHYADASVKNATNFVWARGLRNPFGVAMVGERYFITDVGPNNDRFLEVERGGDYGYDGTDWSVASHAKVVFAPSAAPVQLVYVSPEQPALPPEWRDMFYLVASGDQLNIGPSQYGKKSLIRIKYDFARNDVVDRPFEVVKYVGDGTMMPVGLGAGPDGLYMVIFNPRLPTSTYVMKVRYEPEHEHGRLIERADELIDTHACFGCHRDDGQSPGPSLASSELVPRLTKFLGSPEYYAQSKQLDRLEQEPFRSFRKARREVREAKGEDKLRLWVKYRIMEPRFDRPNASMPRLGIDEFDAASIAAKLIKHEDHTLASGVERYLVALVPKPRQRHLVIFFIFGVAFGGFVAGTLFVGLRARLRRSSSRGSPGSPKSPIE